MEIGKFNRRISLQQRSATLDSYGQQVVAWTTTATVWANIKPKGGKEKDRPVAMVVESELTHTVTIRYNANFLPPTTVDSLRILYGSRIFNIVAAYDVDEAHKHIVFECTEGNINGQ